MRGTVHGDICAIGLLVYRCEALSLVMLGVRYSRRAGSRLPSFNMLVDAVVVLLLYAYMYGRPLPGSLDPSDIGT